MTAPKIRPSSYLGENGRSLYASLSPEARDKFTDLLKARLTKHPEAVERTERGVCEEGLHQDPGQRSQRQHTCGQTRQAIQEKARRVIRPPFERCSGSSPRITNHTRTQDLHSCRVHTASHENAPPASLPSA